MGAPIYLDYNASTPLRPEARVAMVGALDSIGNPSSVHAQGRQARRLVEEARASVASLVRAAPAAVVFTSGGTEANALAIRRGGRRRVLVSAVEHDSALSAVPDAAVVPVDANGIVRLDLLSQMLAASDEPALVALMLVNNETGVVQPVAAAAEIAHACGALLHCDAVQAAGRPASAHSSSAPASRSSRSAVAARSAGAAPGRRTSSASPASGLRRRWRPRIRWRCSGSTRCAGSSRRGCVRCARRPSSTASGCAVRRERAASACRACRRRRS